MDRLLGRPMTRISKAHLRDNIDGLVSEFRTHLVEYESYKLRAQSESEVQRCAIIELANEINSLKNKKPIVQKCSHCHEPGHKTTTCSKRKSDEAAMNR